MVLLQKELASNVYWLNSNVEKSDLQLNSLRNRYYWLKLYKGPFIKLIYSWVGIDVDKVRFSYLSLFLKYFFGVTFLFSKKYLGRDNKKIFYIVKGLAKIKKRKVNHYTNLKEELLVYLKKGREVKLYNDEKAKSVEILFENLEIVFNKRLSNKFALFFPIMTAKFFVIVQLHRSMNFLALKNV